MSSFRGKVLVFALFLQLAQLAGYPAWSSTYNPCHLAVTGPQDHGHLFTSFADQKEEILGLALFEQLPPRLIDAISLAADRFGQQSLPLPRMYPSDSYTYDFGGEDSASSGLPKIFTKILNIAIHEERRFNSKWWRGMRLPVVKIKTLGAFWTKSLSDRYGIEVVKIGFLKTVVRFEASRDYTGAMRKTLAASKINQRLGIKTVPEAEAIWLKRYFFGFSNVILAISSEITPGVILGEASGPKRSKILTDKLGTSSDTEAFEFLIGNMDVHAGNLSAEEDSNLFVFDHNFAFAVGLVPVAEHKRVMGGTLPERYTPQFVAGIRALTPQALNETAGSLLTEQEYLWTLFRREIILADIEIRGSAAL